MNCIPDVSLLEQKVLILSTPFSFYSIHPIEAFSFRTYPSNDDQSDREHKYMALTVATRLKQATVE